MLISEQKTTTLPQVHQINWETYICRKIAKEQVRTVEIELRLPPLLFRSSHIKKLHLFLLYRTNVSRTSCVNNFEVIKPCSMSLKRNHLFPGASL